MDAEQTIGDTMGTFEFCEFCEEETEHTAIVEDELGIDDDVIIMECVECGNLFLYGEVYEAFDID